MKIIATDNYARESVADTLVCENVHEAYADIIVDALNNGTQSDRWFLAVADDYRLSRGMEDLV